MPKKIFLSAGGTGGHVFPAISLMEEDKDNKYYFLIDKRTENILIKRKLSYFKIESSRIKLNIFLPFYLFKISIGIIQSIFIFLNYKPDLVVGFGGYTSIPSIIAAKLLNIKIIIHEQNAVMGRANQILSYLTNNIALTFENTKNARKDSVYTGIPIRKNNLKAKKKSLQKTIFIVGGSQGALAFSTIIPRIISNFSRKNKKKLLIIQQTRKGYKEELEKIYNQMKLTCEVKEFFENIYEQYNNADVIISRCGASTLAEIQCFKKSAILLPLPSSMNNHQYLNAIEFKKKNKCIILDEKKIQLESETKIIEKYIFLKPNSYKLKKNTKNNINLTLSKLINKILNQND